MSSELEPNPTDKMTLKAQIERALQNRFPEGGIEVRDDSAKHAGHAGAIPGGETHFAVSIIDAEFNGLSRLDRHREVNKILQPYFAQGLHALAIDARGRAE